MAHVLTRCIACGTIACCLGLTVVSTVPAAHSVYCERPDNAGAFPAASPGVPCGTARGVVRTLRSTCWNRNRCVVDGFRCIAEWDGRFDRPFFFTHHALCNSGWRWIEWDGG